MRTQVSTLYQRLTLNAVGHGTRFLGPVQFHPPQRISFGHDCLIWQDVDASSESPKGFLQIADRVQINRAVHLDMTGGLTLGADVMISEAAVLYTHDHGINPRGVPRLMPKTIGQGAWIGMRAVILPGCQRIGEGAVVGAGAIVTRDVPSGTIVAGNPARVIGRTGKMRAIA